MSCGTNLYEEWAEGSYYRKGQPICIEQNIKEKEYLDYLKTNRRYKRLSK